MKAAIIIIPLLASGCRIAKVLLYLADCESTETPEMPFTAETTLQNRSVEWMMDGGHVPGHHDAEAKAAFLAKQGPEFCETLCEESTIETADTGFWYNETYFSLVIESCTITVLPESTGDTGDASDTGTPDMKYWERPFAKMECSGIIPADSIGCGG